ncbi:hypothetical protein [Afifella sp. YEN Y35]|uniref:hypothetical protein n=1 Tax=Afifella sp. YEN Y35 TaxID=3388337 RepID=UPI0039E1821D
MQIKVTAIKVSGFSSPHKDALASVDIDIDGEFLIRKCALARRAEGLIVLPPRGNRSSRYMPVAWRRDGETASQINAAAIAAYEALTGKPLNAAERE